MTPSLKPRHLLGVALLCGCVRGEAPRASVSVVDSAGIQIVTAVPPYRADGPGWTLATEPSAQIGQARGEAPYLFEGIVGILRGSDGSTLVCNGGDRTLRRYDRDGSFLGQSAGRGAGPSELRQLSRCFPVGGAVWVYQSPFLPIKVYEASGAFVRAVEMPRPNARAATLTGVLADGSLLLRQDAPRRELAEGLTSRSASVIVAGASSEAPSYETLVVTTGDRWIRRGPLAFPAAFTPSLHALVVGELIVVSWPETFDIAVMTRAGRVVRRIRRALAPVAVEARHRSAFRERIRTGPMPGGDTPFQDAEVRRRIVDMMEYPAVLPAHYRLLVDAEGLLWIERGDAPRDPLPQVADPYPDATTWDVFTVQGRWLATLSFPPRFDPLQIGDDYVVGVHHDELGVERIHEYALERGR